MQLAKLVIGMANGGVPKRLAQGAGEPGDGGAAEARVQGWEGASEEALREAEASDCEESCTSTMAQRLAKRIACCWTLELGDHGIQDVSTNQGYRELAT